MEKKTSSYDSPRNLWFLERFIGILLNILKENFHSGFPQIKFVFLQLLSLHNAYANELNHLFLAKGIHSEVDLRSEKIGFKIRIQF